MGSIGRNRVPDGCSKFHVTRLGGSEEGQQPGITDNGAERFIFEHAGDKRLNAEYTVLPARRFSLTSGHKAFPSKS